MHMKSNPEQSQVEAQSAGPFSEPVQKCSGCGGIVIYTPRWNHRAPAIACDNCNLTYMDLRETVGWLDAKFREDEALVRAPILAIKGQLVRIINEGIDRAYTVGLWDELISLHLALRALDLSKEEIHILHEMRAIGDWMNGLLNAMTTNRPLNWAAPAIQEWHDLERYVKQECEQ